MSSKVRRRFAKTLATYEENAVMQRVFAAELATELACHVGFNAGDVVYEVGAGTGVFTRLLVESHPDIRLVLNDLCNIQPVHKGLVPDGTQFLIGDAQVLDVPQGIRHVVAASSLQWLADPAAFIARCGSVIPSGGSIAFVTYGPSNFLEVREVSGRGLVYPSAEDWSRMVQEAGFEIAGFTHEKRCQWFDGPMDVFRSLKFSGVTGGLGGPVLPAELRRICKDYQTRFGTDKGVSLTWDPILIIGIKR